MTNKEWLTRAWKIDKEIKTLLDEQDETFGKCISITSSMRTVVVTQSGDQHKDDTLIKLAGYNESIQSKVDELLETKQEILKAVSLIDSTTYRTLLYLRYLRFKTWEEIAVEMNYTFRNVIYLHGKALQEIVIIDS